MIKEKIEKETKDEIKKKEEMVLKQTIDDIEKQFGKGSIMKMSDRDKSGGFPCYPSGSIKLDKILGGGYPKGRIVEIYGPEGSGKTTLAIHAIAEVQKSGRRVAYIDVEHAIDVNYMQRLGVDVDDLVLSQPDCGEDALDITQKLITSGIFGMVVVDSVAALTPRAEIDGEFSDAQMGLLARLMSKAMRKLTGITNQTGTTVIFINQLREKIGVVYGNPEITTGGRALRFAASVRLDIRRKEEKKLGTEIIGHKLNIKTAKNKMTVPSQQIQLDLIYGKGFDIVGEYLDIATDKDIVQKSGSWFSYQGEKLGQGRENIIELLKLKENQGILEEIKETVKQSMKKNT